MTLRKTLRLEQYAAENGYSNLRYDQECVGLSSGQQTTIEFEHWVEDALAMVDHICQGPVLLVASSLGSWVLTKLQSVFQQLLSGKSENLKIRILSEKKSSFFPLFFAEYYPQNLLWHLVYRLDICPGGSTTTWKDSRNDIFGSRVQLLKAGILVPLQYASGRGASTSRRWWRAH